MPLELLTVPCLEDNYAFLLHNSDSGETLLVDAPEAAPIQASLDAQGWILTDILLTHHHWDHVDGLPALRGSARVIGAAADADRLPPLDLAVSEGDDLTICGAKAQVFDVSGHTINHIAVYVEAAGVVFTADSLMALGCGRLFEGTPAQMWQSMQKLRILPDETRVCSGHEYTETNARFALTIEPQNADLISRIDEITKTRAAGLPTVPSELGLEKRTNPFLRADVSALQSAMSMVNQDPTDVFAAVRKKRDTFQ
ncbi:hydroxyacylglutathione hydrolase [Octadecabacter sp. 1_MG-2023]|uniref:hydroxyacylglutathione hydrolase n=1 Tax=unclassified Octadecabacter TaxID=196158 RepID=UPI001C0A160A|nr:MULTISPECIES: hydroxyacylglutathione hydrolase [unclassified Octadecabacter]MBU2991909.1 hydroxyacylglutathione hydrolase [Octadecabacter sp. B2R22]MDO6735883.1 hydroxyacylglutathione hydrolase [Octadecabacter sp. 1_MG-2023]